MLEWRVQILSWMHSSTGNIRVAFPNSRFFYDIVINQTHTCTYSQTHAPRDSVYVYGWLNKFWFMKVYYLMTNVPHSEVMCHVQHLAIYYERQGYVWILLTNTAFITPWQFIRWKIFEIIYKIYTPPQYTLSHETSAYLSRKSRSHFI